MALQVDVLVDPAAAERPPAGTPIRVELRDTSLADAPARVLATADAVVTETSGDTLATVALDAPDEAVDRATVWAHVDVTGGGDVAIGDYVTTRSNPVPSPEQQPARLPVTVRRVR